MDAGQGHLRRKNVRPRADGKSSIPADAKGRDVSFGAVPGSTTVRVVGDGKSSTSKGNPEFSTLLFVLTGTYNILLSITKKTGLEMSRQDENAYIFGT